MEAEGHQHLLGAEAEAAVAEGEGEVEEQAWLIAGVEVLTCLSTPRNTVDKPKSDEVTRQRLGPSDVGWGYRVDHASRQRERLLGDC